MMKETLLKDFLEFSSEANKRSTVDLKDGLKPVHRRILYTLGGYKPGYIGSAKITGDVLGALHPHSDSSVYDAAVRLAQPFKTRYPLIDFDGNRGTVADPTGYAASRYTKMQLSPIGREVLKDMKKDTIPYVDNYNGTLLEPLYMPGYVPITLMNGSLGIGVGMASSIPPHNLRELANAIEHLAKNPNADTKALMRFIKGPDFPTGGTIANPEALLEAYESGKGSVRIQANYEIKAIAGKTHIIIKEVPYLVDPNTKIIEPLKEMYAEGYEYIEDIQIQTGKGIPFQLDITLSSDAPVFNVVETILKETSIESSYTINFTTHVGDNKFQVKGLKELLQFYIDTNILRVKNAAIYDKKKAEERMEIVVALIKATAQIEEVIKIIKASSNTDEARSSLMKLLGVNLKQVNAILSMRLSQLTKLDANKLIQEQNELEKTINELSAFINDLNAQKEKVINELKELSRKFGDPRRTRIQEVAEAGEVQDITVFLTENNEIYAQPNSSLESNNRNTKGRKGENLISVLETKSNALIWVGTEDGFVYPVNAATLMVSDDIVKNTVENFGVRGKASLLTSPLNKKYLITLTDKGTVKKSEMSLYKKTSIFKSAKIRESEKMTHIFFSDEKDSMVILLDNNQYVKFETSEINPTGANTIGTQIGGKPILSVAMGDRILFVDGEGNGKQVKIASLKSSGRKSLGIVCNNSTSLHSIKEGQHVFFIGEEGHTIRLSEFKISTNSSPATKGVILYNGKIAKILT